MQRDESTNRQMPNAWNNPRTMLHRLLHTKTDIDTHTHVHLYMPVINLTVSLEAYPSVTDVSVLYRCFPSTSVIQSLGTQLAA